MNYLDLAQEPVRGLSPRRQAIAAKGEAFLQELGAWVREHEKGGTT